MMEDRHPFQLHQPDGTTPEAESNAETMLDYPSPQEESPVRSRSHRHLQQQQQDGGSMPVRPSAANPRELKSKESVMEYINEARGDSTDDNFQAYLRKSHKRIVGGDEEEGEADGHHQDERHHGHDHSHGDQGHHPMLSIPWYCRPVQRQRWDDDQVLPHVNWGSLFFDLFFVAAAYNLGIMILSALAGGAFQWPRGVVYFIGIFGPLYNIWENDVMWSSRYTLVDHSHRIVSVVRFACVSLAVLSIKPIPFLSDKHSFETLALTSALAGESILHLGLKLELYFFAEGDRAAIQNDTRRKILFRCIPATLTYLAAACVAGYSFFHVDNDKRQQSQAYEGGYNDDHATDASNSNHDTSSSSAYNTDDHHHDDGGGHFLFRLLAASGEAAATVECTKEDGHRVLAGDGGGEGGDSLPCKMGMEWGIQDVPLLLCMTVYFFNIVHTLCRQYDTVGRRDETAQYLRQNYVPMNVDFTFHRYGEWLMLMIGESILSLLIVETVETQEYYGIAALGCLTVIMIQMIIFESEPSHDQGHALWRSMFTSTVYGLLIQLLSMSLIAFGVSYKIMLTNVLISEKDAEAGHRMLGGAPPTISDRLVASLYCYSLATILLTLELMLMTQKAVSKSYYLLFREICACRFWSINWPLMIICLFKFVLIAYTITLSQWAWATHTLKVNIMGFLIVTNMATTRVVGWGIVQHEQDIMDTMVSIKSHAISIMHSARSLPSMRKLRSKYPSKSSSNGSVSSGSLSATSDCGGSMDMDEALWDEPLDKLEQAPTTNRTGEIQHLNKYVI